MPSLHLAVCSGWILSGVALRLIFVSSVDHLPWAEFRGCPHKGLLSSALTLLSCLLPLRHTKGVPLLSYVARYAWICPDLPRSPWIWTPKYGRLSFQISSSGHCQAKRRIFLQKSFFPIKIAGCKADTQGYKTCYIYGKRPSGSEVMIFSTQACKHPD